MIRFDCWTLTFYTSCLSFGRWLSHHITDIRFELGRSTFILSRRMKGEVYFTEQYVAIQIISYTFLAHFKPSPWVDFTNPFSAHFSQNVTRKKTFVWKTRAKNARKNVGEIDPSLCDNWWHCPYRVAFWLIPSLSHMSFGDTVATLPPSPPLQKKNYNFLNDPYVQFLEAIVWNKQQSRCCSALPILPLKFHYRI